MPAMTAVRWTVAILWLASLWLVLGVPALGIVLAARAAPTLALPILPPVTQDGAGRIVLGRCYREQVGALIHVHLEGDPVTIGYSQGLLVGDGIARIERELMDVFVERAPSFLARHLLLGLVYWNNISLERFFQAGELAEIAAIAEGYRRAYDPYGAVSPPYIRSLQYHALHDVSQYLIDNPLVHPPQVGCTAVAVRGTRSRDGHLLVGRLFDFEGGRCFDVDKVVFTMRPTGGIPFVSVSWGGMAGAVTGMNDAGLWVSVNAAATDGQAFVGRPTVMVVREILERCRTIDAALAVIRAAPVFVSDGFLLASGEEDRAVAAERGPHGLDVREMADQRLVLTNHFLAPQWRADTANAGRIAHGTTAKRFARAEGLLAATAQHDPASLLALLRDRRGAAGEDVGFGNRGTINAWIGAHLVVADMKAKVMWVCEPSHGLGRAIPFGIDGPLDQPPLPASPDAVLHDQAADEYRLIQDRVVALLRAGQRDHAAPLADRLLVLNPEGFEANALAAECSPDPAQRRRLLERSLALQPAYPADAEKIRALIDAGK